MELRANLKNRELGTACFEAAIVIPVLLLIIMGTTYLGRSVGNLVMIQQMAYTSAMTSALSTTTGAADAQARLTQLKGLNSSKILSGDFSPNSSTPSFDNVNRIVTLKVTAPLVELPFSLGRPSASKTIKGPLLTSRNTTSAVQAANFENADRCYDCNGNITSGYPPLCTNVSCAGLVADTDTNYHGVIPPAAATPVPTPNPTPNPGPTPEPTPEPDPPRDPNQIDA